MAFPYGRAEHYSPLGNDGGRVYFASPEPLQQQFSSYGDLGSPDFEMHENLPGRPPMNRQSGNSFHSAGSQSTFVPSAQSRRQALIAVRIGADLEFQLLRLNLSYTTLDRNMNLADIHPRAPLPLTKIIPENKLFRYIIATKVWMEKKVVSENQKKIYNAITTSISIALGLNIASAFKDMAINMRWPILSTRKRSLTELDLILHADSLSDLWKLAFVAHRPLVTTACILWLLINIAAQAGIAMLSLTYGFEVNYEAVQLSSGNASTANMTHFFPLGGNPNPSVQDEQYTAHLYGELSYQWGVNDSQYMPEAGDIYKGSNAMLWYNNQNASVDFVFSDSGSTPGFNEVASVYTTRKITMNYVCDSYPVIAGGDGKHFTFTVENIGDISVTGVPESTTYFTDPGYVCEAEESRCGTIQAFEASSTDPWYYTCNITLGPTQGDPRNLSFISKETSWKALAAIAQIGYTDQDGQAASIYPNDSIWGIPLHGSQADMGQNMAIFGLGAIAGASVYNPSIYFQGDVPYQGFYLNLAHANYFYLIIGLILGCQLFFCVVVAILANTVQIGPDEHLSMSLLLRPIANDLERVSGGRDNKDYRNAKKHTFVRYEKAMNGRWILNMT